MSLRSAKHKSGSRSAAPAQTADSKPAMLELAEYTIIYDAMEDDDQPEYPPEVADKINDLARRCLDGERGLIESLESVVKSHPEIRLPYNLLASAYEAEGRKEDAAAMVERTYQMFPDYLFAFANRVMQLVQSRDLDEAERVIANRFAIHHFVPNRRTYHVTEFVSFSYAICVYKVARFEFDVAASYYDMLRQVAPDDPRVAHLGMMLAPTSPLRLLSSMRETLSGRSRKKRAARQPKTVHREAASG